MKDTKELLQDKRILYIINGSLIFLINILLAYSISFIKFSSHSRIQNNLVNIITTELMVIISYFIHNHFTWKNKSSRFFYKLFRYHLAMALSISIRLVSFAFFDFLKFPFMVSTILSISIIILLNFISFDKFVFNVKE